MKLLKVKNKKRYHFIGFNELESFQKKDLSKSIIIIDESHRLIELLDSNSQEIKNHASQLYLKIQKAHKIIALTGTPIYSEPINLAYQINLVAGKKILETNKVLFHANFMKINSTRSFFRGYALESQIAFNTFPTYLSSTAAIFGLPVAATFITGLAVPLSLVFLRNQYPLDSYSLRSFEANSLKEVTSKYVSYYGFDNKESMKDYPTKSVELIKIPYNDQQYAFLLSSLDRTLTVRELDYLLRDQRTKEMKNRHTKEYLELNTNSIQENFINEVGYGRHIGNMVFSEKGRIYTPPKFKALLKKLKKADGPSVIYSHYYENGLLLFYKYLKKNNYGDKDISILHPEDSIKEQDGIIKKYNLGLTKILLIHPEITEGISLKGTSQLHFLEVSINKAFQDQMIGRAIRFQSHSHLSPEKRHVKVYIWLSTIDSWNPRKMAALRYNWYKRYSELNYYSQGGTLGRLQIDKAANLKNISPDSLVYSRLNSLDYSMRDLKKHLMNFSIESEL